MQIFYCKKGIQKLIIYVIMLIGKEYKEVNKVEEKETVIVIDKDGKEREAEVLVTFRIHEYNKEYILYTFDEVDENEMVKIYASTLVEKGDMFSFEAIETPEEWATIKDVMRDMAQSKQGQA